MRAKGEKTERDEHRAAGRVVSRSGPLDAVMMCACGLCVPVCIYTTTSR